MPLDVIVPEHSLRSGAAAPLMADITEALLRWTDAADDEALRANVGVYLHEMSRASVFAGGRSGHVARLDVKLPVVALSTQPRRSGFIADATTLLRAAAADGAPYDRVWINIVHAVDGGWGVDGLTLVGDEHDG